MTVFSASQMDELIHASRKAGDVIMDIFQRDDKGLKQKSDLSPVTEADERAEVIILPILQRLTPDIPIIAEESYAAGKIPDRSSGTFWLVDPLDGTKEFINKGTDFTVNIGLIVDGKARIGVVYCPALDQLYIADGSGESYQIHSDGTCTQLRVQQAQTPWRVVGSKSHKTPETDAYLEKVPVKEFISRGSSLKFCLLATGQADFYPRLGPTMEWDTAAAHAILSGAGGYVTHMDRTPFTYGKTDYRNGHFLAVGGINPSDIPIL